jgi:hypothetical protein
VVLSAPKVFLEDIEEDPAGTEDQTRGQREKGRRHILADLWTEEGEGEHLGRWRIVTADPLHSTQDPPVLTVLPLDRGEARTAANLTDMLDNEVKSGNSPWLDPEHIATVLRPLVQSGQITNQAGLGAYIREREQEPLKEELEALAKAQAESAEKLERAKHGMTQLAKQVVQAQEQARQAEEDGQRVRAQLEEALKALAERPSVPAPDAQDAFDPLGPQDATVQALRAPAARVTSPWRSKTNGPGYINQGVNAYVEDVQRRGNQICLRYVDSHGRVREVLDWGVRNGFVAEVFDYLTARRGQRAVFILTAKPNDTLRLASDTMMLNAYRSLWL